MSAAPFATGKCVSNVVLVPPAPAYAEFDLSSKYLRVELDKEATSVEELDVGNWSFAGNGWFYYCVEAECDGWNVNARFSKSDTDTGSPRCSYLPPPYDVTGIDGAPMAEFTDFPVVIVP